MKSLKPLLLSLPFVLTFACKAPEKEKNWYKGNLHTHSYWSDGDEFPEMIMNWYKGQGYHFVALTDHNTLAEGDKWKVIPEDSLHQAGFERYLKEYGVEWVNYKLDSAGRRVVKLKTYNEYTDLFEENEKFLIIKAEEITDGFEGKPLHMNATNIQSKIEAQGGGSVVEVLQNNIDQVLKQREETGVPIMPHINHPNFGYAITLNDMIALKGERFFEVYNGHPTVHNEGNESHISTEEMWDKINIAYLKANKPMMQGLATDDTHHYHSFGKSWSNAGRGWVMVHADSLNAASLIHAMEAGDFYSSTGVTLKKLSFEDKKLTVEIDGEEGITYTTTFVGVKKGADNSEVLSTTEALESSFEMTDDLLYIRCKVTSSKLQDNPIENLIYEMAWTQPVF
ncbi:histidinol-phosphatase [uncultured Arcticibacterium sp.]|uniref:histidinol-phosphatase n=1 Tax=uncultured Arcticibacterium sp. TaxID=2173042 RepID=UPI0030F4C04E